MSLPADSTRPLSVSAALRAAWRHAFAQAARPISLRTLIVFAHPDDEAIGAGSLLPRFTDVRFVCVTNGAPPDPADARRCGCATREEYAALRRRELQAALAAAGHDRAHLRLFEIGDQQASLNLREIMVRLASEIAAYRPQLIITHPYEGGHPDHDATAFAVHMACRSRRSVRLGTPAIVEMTSYHSRGGAMHFGDFLPASGREPLTVRLDEIARERKRQLLACHRSQAPVLAAVPLDHERFRAAPDYDFGQPPHTGRLLYEQFEWGMDGERWRRLAQAALVGEPPIGFVPAQPAYANG